MTNYGNILPPGQFEHLSFFFGIGQEVLPRTITGLKSQVPSCMWHVFFAQLLSKNKVQRTSESTVQTVSGEDKTGPVLMREQWKKRIPMNNAPAVFFLKLLVK